MRALIVLLSLSLTLAAPLAIAQSKDGGGGGERTSSSKDSNSDSSPGKSSSNARTGQQSATSLKSDGASGPKTITAVRQLDGSLLIPGSNRLRRIGGYSGGAVLTEGWSCNEATGTCTCTTVSSCTDLAVAPSEGKSISDGINTLYTVQEEDHSSG